MSGGDPAPGDQAVEQRLAAELAPLARPRSVGGATVPPHPYVRRYAVEHAADGGVLDDRFVNETFLPYVDVARLRSIGSRGAPQSTAGDQPALLRTWRMCAHSWQWDDPER